MALGNPILLPGQALRTLTITGTPVLTATAGVPYEGFALVGSGGVAPLTFGASVPPPASIAADPVTGDVAGTPLVAGVSVGITFTVTDATGAVASLDPFDLTVAAPVQISGTPVTTAIEGEPYDGFTVTGSEGTAPLVYAVHTGVFPAGIGIDPDTGEVAGTPTESGAFVGIVLDVTDTYGSTADLPAFDLTVSPPPPPPPGYTCGGVVFDGATFLTKAALVATDNQDFSMVQWVYVTDPSTQQTNFVVDAAGAFENASLYQTPGAGAVVLSTGVGTDDNSSYISADASMSLGAWHCYMYASHGTASVIALIDGVDVTANITQIGPGGTLSFNGKSFDIGNFAGGTVPFINGYMSDTWIAPGQLLDLADSAVIAKFISGGKPVDLGADGSTPTGTAPAIFLHIDAAGDPAGFGDNLGTGGAFSVNVGVTQTGALVNTSADVVMSDVTGITVGAFVTVTGVPAGTTVLSINTLTVTMSAPATATNPTASIKFGGVLRLAPSSPSD